MSPTYLVPIAFAPTHSVSTLLPQEPATTDKPAPANPGAAPAPTGVPGTPGTQAPQQPGGQPQQPCGTEMWIMMPALLLLMYFMVIRPESRRRKEQQTLLSSIKVGDRVVTMGGMHGTIAKLTEKTVTLRVDTLHVEFDRTAVARVERGDASAPAKG
jgi:preprotein translocase subunit YajC